MEETIDLRDIIEIILKGKWIIVVCTIILVALAAVYSIATKSESYTSTATVQVTNADPTDTSTTSIMKSYTTAEFTPAVYLQRFTQHAAEIGTITSINEPNTNVISLTSTATSAAEAKEQLQQAIEATMGGFETSILTDLKDTSDEYLKESEQLSTEVEELLQRYNEIVRTNKLPGVLLLQTVLASNVTLTLPNDQLASFNNIDGQTQNELLQLKSQIDIKVGQYRTLLGNYQSIQTGVDSFKIGQYIRTIVEPTEATMMSSPNMKLNVLIGLVLGLMLGVATVFFRAYWRATAKGK